MQIRWMGGGMDHGWYCMMDAWEQNDVGVLVFFQGKRIRSQSPLFFSSWTAPTEVHGPLKAKRKQGLMIFKKINNHCDKAKKSTTDISVLLSLLPFISIFIWLFYFYYLTFIFRFTGITAYERWSWEQMKAAPPALVEWELEMRDEKREKRKEIYRLEMSKNAGLQWASRNLG